MFVCRTVKILATVNPLKSVAYSPSYLNYSAHRLITIRWMEKDGPRIIPRVALATRSFDLTTKFVKAKSPVTTVR
jgi:hypothetical protein